MFPMPCVIFAGGRSRRMGTDKALLPFGSSATLAAYQFHRLAPLFEHTYLSVRDTRPYLRDFPVIADPDSAHYAAPTAGFIAVFSTLGAERIFVLSVDTPFIDADVISALVDADRPDLDAVVARTSEGIHPLCGIYHRSLEKHFRAMHRTGRHRLGELLKNTETAYVDFEDDTLFTNLNDPQSYQAALQRKREE